MIMREAGSGGDSWSIASRLSRVKMGDAVEDWHNDKVTFTFLRCLHKIFRDMFEAVGVQDTRDGQY